MLLVCSAAAGHLTASETHAQAPTSPKTLTSAIRQLLNDEAYSNAIWAAKVVNLSSGDVLFEQHADKSLMPASNAKMYTTSAALDLLGPDFKFKTTLHADGPIEQGVLKGNLIVRGSGDPTIGERYVKEDPARIFRAWAQSLKGKGIRRIDGDIIGDDDLFDELPLGYGWSWDDEPYYYSAEISALSFYDNSIQFILEGQRVGMPGKLRWEPFNTSYVDVVNSSLTVHPASDDDIEYNRLRNFNTIEAIGEIYPQDKDTSYISVSNPTKYFVHVFRDVLIQEGIAVSGRPMDIDDLSIKPDYASNTLEQVLVHHSPPLSEIIVILNKESQNLYAELLLRAIGMHRPVADDEAVPGSAEMGLLSALETYGRAGADTSRIKLVDGSGLSRMNLITADMTAHLLAYMWRHENDAVRSAFYASLPLGGEGTLEDRFRRGAAFRNVRAKTGTLSSVSSLSGYVSSAGGTPLLFVLMCNNFTTKTSAVRRTQNAVVNLLARYGQ